MKRRKPNNREPPGKTKTTILLLVANNGETSFQAIRDHLKDSLNIRNLKVLRTHLAELIEDKLLLKRSQGKGKPDTYYLNGFDNFKNLHEFFQDNQLEQEFMKTQYYHHYVTSEDFKGKWLINLLQESINQRHCSIIDKIEKEDKDDRIKNQHRRLVETIENSFIEDIEDKLQNRLGDHQLDNRSNNSLLLRSSFVISKDEFEDIIDILLLSPSALRYSLKPKYADPLLLQKIMEQLFDERGFSIEFFNEIIEYNFNSLTKEDNESLTILILKSLFITDLLTNKIVKRDDSNHFLSKFLKTSDKNEPITNSRLWNQNIGRKTKIKN
ncbi:hypothetical protein [Methanocella arvoryzae]|nr:hypothetical protein [Methanocella arvoryzae]